MQYEDDQTLTAQLGLRIKKAREYRGLTQKQLLTNLGWKANTNSKLSNYEKGLAQPSLAGMNAIAEELDVNKNWLINGEGDMLRGLEDHPDLKPSEITDLLIKFMTLSDANRENVLNYVDQVFRLESLEKSDK